MCISRIKTALSYIALGLLEKEALILTFPNKYPYSEKLQTGINMFLAIAFNYGEIGMEVFTYANEASFLNKYIELPIREWFSNWDQEVREKIMNESFSNYDSFGKIIKKNMIIPTDECREFTEAYSINSNQELSEELDLYEYIIQFSQEDYVSIREFIIRHPIVNVEQRRKFLIKHLGNPKMKEAFQLAYELYDKPYIQCPKCGWTLTKNIYGYTCMNESCTSHLPLFSDDKIVDASIKPIYRLKKGVMRYFCIPGKLELELADYCADLELKYQLYPQKDKYDIEIHFNNDDVWEIDAKAYKNPVTLCEKLYKEKFPAGNYSRGFIVIPKKYANKQYLNIVNKALKNQERVECIDSETLKRMLKKKVGEKNEK